jgi:hypothetical protein
MTATIPPTSAPPRRRADEKSRKPKRRAPEGNRIEDGPVDKDMPKTTRRTDTSRKAGEAEAGRRTAKSDPPAPGTRRSAAARTKGAERSRADTRSAAKTRAVPRTKSREARGAVDAEKTRAKSRKAAGAVDAGKTRAKSRRAAVDAEKTRPAPGTRRAAGTARPAPDKTRGGRARTVPGTKRVEEVRGADKDRAAGSSRTGPAPRARTPFVLLIVGLLAGALVSLLLLNTVLAQDAFTLSELQRGNHQLGERRQALQEEVDRESSPQGLHARARSLGMRDVPRPAFIDSRTGRVIEGGVRPPGVRDDAVAAAGATAVTGVPGAIVPPPRTPRTDGGTR